MHSRHRERAVAEAEPFQDGGFPARTGRRMEGGVVHDIADVLHACGDSLPGQILDRGAGRTVKDRAHMIAEHAVDLLRHPAIERTQPRFHVGQRECAACRGQCAGQGGVGVAIDQHGSGSFREEDRHQSLHHPSGHWCRGHRR